MISFGRFGGISPQPESSGLLFSDWHCSVYSTDDGKVLFRCGPNVSEIACVPNMVCSNSSNVFILSNTGSITSIKKLDASTKIVSIKKYRMISANDEELFCISDENFVTAYSLQNAAQRPVPNNPLPVKVKTVACGAGFALFLTPSGTVFSKGIGTRGQLGHGDLESRTEPEIIAALEPLTVCAIACGTWHSVCLTDSGDVYTWGSNEYGQLGCPSINLEKSRRPNDPFFTPDTCVNVMALPAPVDIPDDRLISSIACGSRHTACLSEENELFMFGWNGYGQLGFLPKYSDVPGRRIHETASDSINKVLLPFPPDRALTLSCGHWSTHIKEAALKL